MFDRKPLQAQFSAQAHESTMIYKTVKSKINLMMQKHERDRVQNYSSEHDLKNTENNFSFAFQNKSTPVHGNTFQRR